MADGGLPFSYRAATASDEDRLSSFTCSRGVDCEDEVESYITAVALERALATDSRALFVFFDEDRLIAVAGFREELVPTETTIEDESGGQPKRGLRVLLAIRLEVLALSRVDRGRVLEGGLRLSDAVMAVLIDEAMGGGTSAVVTAVVAQNNLPSLSMCERAGLTSQVEFSPGYVRLSRHFTRR